MISATTNDAKNYLVWMFALLLFMFGWRYAKEMIAFVLDKLYQMFIQNNPNAS